MVAFTAGPPQMVETHSAEEYERRMDLGHHRSYQDYLEAGEEALQREMEAEVLAGLRTVTQRTVSLSPQETRLSVVSQPRRCMQGSCSPRM